MMDQVHSVSEARDYFGKMPENSFHDTIEHWKKDGHTHVHLPGEKEPVPLDQFRREILEAKAKRSNPQGPATQVNPPTPPKKK